MGTLTLARYALEMSLMSLSFSRLSESLLAAASLLLAKRMKGTANQWVRPRKAIAESINLPFHHSFRPVHRHHPEMFRLFTGRAGVTDVGLEPDVGATEATFWRAERQCLPQVQPRVSLF
jgi:hypothetical protein